MTGGPLSSPLSCVRVTRRFLLSSWAAAPAHRHASCGTAFHGAIGLPCQRVDGGTSSPRITSEAGPTVAPAPMRAAGSATQCGPSVEPSSSTTVSIRMIRSWNRWVCTTQPRLTVAPFVEGDQVGLGQPVRLAPDAAADLGAERAQPQVHHRRAAGGAGEPRRRDRLDEGVRHLVAPHERRPQRVLDRPDTARPQAISRSLRCRRRPRPRSAAPRRWPAPPTASRTRPPAHCSANSTADADRERHDHRDQPARLHQRAQDLQPQRTGGTCAARRPRSACGATEPAGCPATTSPPWPCAAPRDSTATSPSSGTSPARLGDAGVAEERPLADRRLGDVDPAAAQFVGRHHGVVGQECAVLDDGELRRQQRRRDLGAPADFRAEQRAATTA